MTEKTEDVEEKNEVLSAIYAVQDALKVGLYDAEWRRQRADDEGSAEIHKAQIEEGQDALSLIRDRLGDLEEERDQYRDLWRAETDDRVALEKHVHRDDDADAVLGARDYRRRSDALKGALRTVLNEHRMAEDWSLPKRLEEYLTSALSALDEREGRGERIGNWYVGETTDDGTFSLEYAPEDAARRRADRLEEARGDVLGWIESILSNDPHLTDTSEMLLRKSFRRLCSALDSREDEGRDCTCEYDRHVGGRCGGIPTPTARSTATMLTLPAPMRSTPTSPRGTSEYLLTSRLRLTSGAVTAATTTTHINTLAPNATNASSTAVTATNTGRTTRSTPWRPTRLQ